MAASVVAIVGALPVWFRAWKHGQVWLLDAAWDTRWPVVPQLLGWGDGVRDAPLWHLLARSMSPLGRWAVPMLVTFAIGALGWAAASLVSGRLQQWAAALAVAANPWTFDRVDAGQLALLLGAAAALVAVRRCWRQEGSWRGDVLCLVLAGGFSPHALAVGAVIVTAVAVRRRRVANAANIAISVAACSAYLWWGGAAGSRGGGADGMAPSATVVGQLFGWDVFPLADNLDIRLRIVGGSALWLLAMLAWKWRCGNWKVTAGTAGVGVLLVASSGLWLRLADVFAPVGLLREPGKLAVVTVIAVAVAAAEAVGEIARRQQGSQAGLVCVLALSAGCWMGAGWVDSGAGAGLGELRSRYGEGAGMLVLPWSQYVTLGNGWTVRQPVEAMLPAARVSGDSGIAGAVEDDPYAAAIGEWVESEGTNGDDVLLRGGISKLLLLHTDVTERWPWIAQLSYLRLDATGEAGDLTWQVWSVNGADDSGVRWCGAGCWEIPSGDHFIPDRAVAGFRASGGARQMLTEDGAFEVTGPGRVSWEGRRTGVLAWLVAAASWLLLAATGTLARARHRAVVVRNRPHTKRRRNTGEEEKKPCVS